VPGERRPQQAARDALEDLVAPALGLLDRGGAGRAVVERRVGDAALERAQDRPRALDLLAVVELQARHGAPAEERLHDQRLARGGQLDPLQRPPLELEGLLDGRARVRAVDQVQAVGHGGTLSGVP
jgi:hypothetical protein